MVITGERNMGKWKDEDIATQELIEDYLKEFEEGIAANPNYCLDETEKSHVQKSLEATKKFCTGLLAGKKKMYMHDLILMAIGFYGGYLSALDDIKKTRKTVSKAS
jgi:hypothetical protein